jgi:hypothetical protein
VTFSASQTIVYHGFPQSCQLKGTQSFVNLEMHFVLTIVSEVAQNNAKRSGISRLLASTFSTLRGSPRSIQAPLRETLQSTSQDAQLIPTSTRTPPKIRGSLQILLPMPFIS